MCYRNLDTRIAYKTQPNRGKANALPKNGAIVEVEVTPSTFGQIKKLYRHLEIMAA